MEQPDSRREQGRKAHRQADWDRAYHLLVSEDSETPLQPAEGEAWYCQGELYRLQGNFSKAETSYRRANQMGRKPQPGLALLKLAQDQPLAATEAIRQAEQENRDPGADRISLSGTGRSRNCRTGIGCRQLDIPPAQLGNIKQPVSLIWGRHDRAIKLKVAEEASNRYGCPKNRTIRIDHRS
jgi:tetratricopeptide (TPR) repeat protein